MEDLRSIIAGHTGKDDAPVNANADSHPTTSEIPDVFFDEVLVDFKLTRVEVMIIMALYRKTYCRPNLYKKHGISPLLALDELEEALKIDDNQFFHSLRSLETYGLIETIRSGQFFVRRYFTEEIDKRYGQSYDSFL
jgi:DNA-binding MarR family transcriptional regulator